jgi:NAD(P)H-flavin reductase
VRVSALIARIAVHSNGTHRILLRLEPPAAAAFLFRAGQYLNVVVDDVPAIPFSIASSPTRLPEIELHFFPLADSVEAGAMSELLARSARLTLEGPFGEVTVDAPSPRPLALIVAGTGAAQAYAIVEFLRSVEQRQPVRLFWHVGDRDALYCDADFRRFAENGWFHYQPLVGASSGRSADGPADWLANERDHLAASDVVLCGSPDFVYSVVDDLHALDIRPCSVRSDVFAYAPR